MSDRNKRNRSRSGAHEECPECSKKLRGSAPLRCTGNRKHGIAPAKKGKADV